MDEECAVCLEHVKDAAESLSCTHSLCFGCAQGLVEHSRSPLCPTCRAPWRDASSFFVEAAASGDVEELARALRAGVDPCSMQMARALVEAVRNGRTEAVVALLVHGADVDASVAGEAAPKGTRERAIDVAVRQGNLAMASILIEAGADVDEWKQALQPHIAE